MTEQTPSLDRRGRNALLWSFFVPPVGFVIGVVLLLRLPKSDSTRIVRSEAKIAAFNGVVSSLIIFKLIGLLRYLLEKLGTLS